MKRSICNALFACLISAVATANSVVVRAQTADLTGTWTNGNVGAVQYQNRITGSTKPGRGSVFSYKFQPNGTYEFVGYMEVSMYNCTTTLFNQTTGRYTLAGSTLVLDAKRDFWKSTNSCAASGNKEQTKPPVKKSLSFDVRSDEYGRQLLCLNEGNGETCYRREEN